MLVGDDAQAIAFLRELEHGLEKVAAMRAEHPAGAQDHMARAGTRDRLLAAQLGRAIHRERISRVGFGVGGGLFTVKHVVGGNMHEACAGIVCGLSHHTRRDRVDRFGDVGLRLGPVNGRVGRCVNNDGGPHAIDQCAYRIVERSAI